MKFEGRRFVLSATAVAAIFPLGALAADNAALSATASVPSAVFPMGAPAADSIAVDATAIETVDRALQQSKMMDDFRRRSFIETWRSSLVLIADAPRDPPLTMSQAAFASEIERALRYSQAMSVADISLFMKNWRASIGINVETSFFSYDHAIAHAANIIFALGVASSLMWLAVVLPWRVSDFLNRMRLKFGLAGVQVALNANDAEELLAAYSNEVKQFCDVSRYLEEIKVALNKAQRDAVNVLLDARVGLEEAATVLRNQSEPGGLHRYLYEIAENILQRRLLNAIATLPAPGVNGGNVDNVLRGLGYSEGFKRHGFWHSQLRVLRSVNVIQVETPVSIHAQNTDGQGGPDSDSRVGWSRISLPRLAPIAVQYAQREPLIWTWLLHPGIPFAAALNPRV